MFISRLSRRNQFAVLAILAIALCSIFYLYVIGPLGMQVASVGTEVEALELEVANGEVIKRRLVEIKQEVATQEAKLNELRKILPDEKETAQIIRQVQQLAVDSHLKIKSFTPRTTINNIFYEDWPILISFEGNYDNLGSFFEKIGDFRRIINVEDINIQAIDEGATRDRTLSATCTATTFVFLHNPEVEGQPLQGEL